jgi:hypothetical protein
VWQPSRCKAAVMETARTSFGTDEDVLLIRFHD